MHLEKQRYGRNKQTLINSSYIDGGEYRRKFDRITDNEDINRIIYVKAKEMLKHRSGTKIEDMYWINADTGEVVAKVTDQTIEEQIDYPDAVKKAISGLNNLIAIHTHPNSLPPSVADFNSCAKHNYAIGLIICHDGTVYEYQSDETISEKLFDLYVARYIQEGKDEKEAQLKALDTLQDNYSIRFREVR